MSPENDDERLDRYRHSVSHVMAQAVKSLFPHAKLGIGPPIEDGFYYDFDLEEPLTPEILNRLEEEMRNIINSDLPFERQEISHEEARKLFRERGEDYKLELLDELKGMPITIYRDGDFVDLCRGPHLERTGQIKAFKLLSVAGAYWKGDEQRPMLQRIYGTAFLEEEQLQAYLQKREEAKKRDHRKLGKELDLFSFHDESPGVPFFHPRGVILYQTLLNYWREVHRREGYQEIMTPVILREDLWHQSGHWDHYKNHMYFSQIGEQTFAVKPMNCPGGILFYKEKQHSYREFPLRIAELGRVHRRELTGVLHGLFRVQSFVIDDAHIYCLPEQVKDEIVNVTRLILEIYSVLGFKEYKIEVSTRPQTYIGSNQDWELATRSLKEALAECGIDYEINEGEGAFYGPKIDFHIKDCLERSHQCGTIQLDFSMPERFQLEYIGLDGTKHRPAMIHRAALGSIERFVGILLEHYGGALPLWLSPVQVKVLPISEKYLGYAQEVVAGFTGAGIRAEPDSRNEKIGWKIRAAQLEKVPYMLIVGQEEAASGRVAVRKRGKGELGKWELKKCIRVLGKEIVQKT